MEELERLRAAFAQLDRDGDGFVTVDELTQALQRVPAEVARFDHNADGRLDLSEFIDFSAHVKVRLSPVVRVSPATHHHLFASLAHRRGRRLRGKAWRKLPPRLPRNKSSSWRRRQAPTTARRSSGWSGETGAASLIRRRCI
jgi:hypothetical protein